MLAPATSSDPTAPAAIRQLRPVHNTRTRSNTPVPTSFITEEPVATSEGDTASTEGAPIAAKEGDVVYNNHYAKLRPKK